jgi:hypothetical protein
MNGLAKATAVVPVPVGSDTKAGSPVASLQWAINDPSAPSCGERHFAFNSSKVPR